MQMIERMKSEPRQLGSVHLLYEGVLNAG